MDCVPECDATRGLPSGLSEIGRERVIEARLSAQKADAEWLASPFRPKGLAKFRHARESRAVTNLGDVLAHR